MLVLNAFPASAILEDFDLKIKFSGGHTPGPPSWLTLTCSKCMGRQMYF